MTQAFDIIIAGAGPAGLACAISLAHEGYDVAVIDPSSAFSLKNPSFDGREIALTHHSRQWLTRNGIWDRLAPGEISPLRVARIESGRDVPRNAPSALLFTAPESGPHALGFLVPNHLIRSALFTTAQTIKRINFFTNRSVIASAGNNTEATVTLDGETRLRSALLVAADGRFSPIRQARGIGAVVHDFGKEILVCRVRHPDPHQQVALQWFDEGQTVATLPVSDDGSVLHRSSLILTLDPDEVSTLKTMSPEAFNDAITRRTQSRLGRLTVDSPRCSYPLKTVYAHRFETTRLALIGDAAVGMHPITAHGFNLGLRGQEILCDEIANGSGDPGLTSTLNRFERRQRKASLALFAATNVIASVYTHDAPHSLLLRTLGLRFAQRLSPLKRLVTEFLMDEDKNV